MPKYCGLFLEYRCDMRPNVAPRQLCASQHRKLGARV